MLKSLSVCTAALSVLALLSGPAAASGGSAPSPGESYVGAEYEQGGGGVPINGPLPSVDALADSITQNTDAALADVAARRSTLPYGQIYPNGPQHPQLTTYPAPAGMTPSDQYSVHLLGAGRPTDSFVYKVDARKTDTNEEKDTSWTSFSFAGAVVVSVRKLQGTATGCVVRPASAHVRTWFVNNTCYFLLTKAANLSVEFAPNTTNPVLHPMLLFANPPEVDIPPATDPNVLYLGPGVHQLGKGVQLHSGETVYLAGGAWVEGAFVGRNVQNVVIRGRGVIDGGFLDTGDQAKNKSQPGLIDITGSSNVVVDGITLVDGPRFNLRAIGNHDTIHNVKIMSWWYSTDGVVAGNKSLIEDNFIKVDDDSIKLFWGDTVARDNVIWQLANGGPFMISWNIEQNSSDFHVYDNDVIHAEQNSLPPQAIFRARHAGAGHMQRYLFDNIRVEDANWRLFYIILENNKWYDPSLGYGQISDLIFRNITATTPFTQPSVFSGIDPSHTVSNVTLENVYMDSACISNAAQGNVQIDPATTDQIRIVKSADGGCAAAATSQWKGH
ncbi:MAG TPA: glycosyl hydrolase family 28 protein [Acidothermaceae bacterium]|nr:glycosyl hydrolase family 28 protein [Acidothermaceae bacterium]